MEQHTAPGLAVPGPSTTVESDTMSYESLCSWIKYEYFHTNLETTNFETLLAQKKPYLAPNIKSLFHRARADGCHGRLDDMRKFISNIEKYGEDLQKLYDESKQTSQAFLESLLGTQTQHYGEVSASTIKIETLEHELDDDDNNDNVPDFSRMGHLMPDMSRAAGSTDRDIGHAPLFSGGILGKRTKDLLPQYGFFGCSTRDAVSLDTTLFQNTNVPYSTFICGVQGSGKSHTTACMLENSLIPSEQLGRLMAPVSALVFSYGEFGNGGKGFNISEFAHLAVAGADFPTAHMEKITVLTSPSNPAIKKFYQQIPNVEVIPFKLKAQTLDIATLLTLMAFKEKVETPLYMATVEQILRTIATESEAGVFDYQQFKDMLSLAKFNRDQQNMLQMRLGLLESFLDLGNEGYLPQPAFEPGSLTIIDLSDPFVNESTACVLFKLCLDRYMQSASASKMVVLDEAHKYMRDNPGAKALTSCLQTLIRLQRHKGVRVIISTQEPTVSPELIALCSVTVVHRFTSPAWYTALRQHITAMASEKELMSQIECLDTGEAFVYAPNTVLGICDDGSLNKATGRLMRFRIRKRITQDGGESIMAL